MREDYGSLPLTLHDDGFGDIGFDADGPDFIRDHVDPNIDVSIPLLTNNIFTRQNRLYDLYREYLFFF